MDQKKWQTLIQQINELIITESFGNILTELVQAVNNYQKHRQESVSVAAIGAASTIDSISKRAYQALIEIRKRKNFELSLIFNTAEHGDPFGDGAIYLLSGVYNRLDKDYPNLVNELNNYYLQLKGYQTLAIELKQLFGRGSSDGEKPDNTVTLYFQGNADVKNLQQLAVASKDWNVIANTFGRLTGENDTEVKIVSIERGSLIATLYFARQIIMAVSSTVNKILDVIINAQKIKIQAENIKLLTLQNAPALLAALETESTINIKVRAEKIAEDLLSQYQIPTNQNSYNEIKSHLVKAISIMFKFHLNGGEVSVKLIEFSEVENEILEKLNTLTVEHGEQDKLLNQITDNAKLLSIDTVDEHPNTEIEDEESTA